MARKAYVAPAFATREVQFETAVSSAQQKFTWYDPTGDDYWKQISGGWQLVDPTNDDTFTQS